MKDLVNIQRKLDRYLGIFLCKLLSLIDLFTSKHPVYHKPHKILIILLSEMGSLVLTTPMFKQLSTAYPHAEVYILTFRKNIEIVSLLNLVQSQNIITIRDNSLKQFFLDSVKALHKMRSIGIDTVIDCELFSRVSSVFSYLSGAKLRAGFHPHRQEGLYRGSFINRPVLYNPYVHISKQFLMLADAFESDTMPLIKKGADLATRQINNLAVDNDKLDSIRNRLNRRYPQLTGRKLILLYPGGGALPIRAWPLEHYCLIAKDFIKKGFSVAVLGLPGDRKLAQSIQSYCNSEQCIDLTDFTETIFDLICMFHIGNLLITNDGGPSHFASVTPISTITFFGPETPLLYGPLSEKAVSIYLSFSCSPCLTAYNHRNSPCDGNNMCLKSITPEYVLGIIDSLL